MVPNPALKRLGFAEDDRVVIIHADDIGMCQATVSAYADLVDFGLISSAATMVPCGWFPLTAAYCRQHLELDMGVHLTLTSEWDACRWRPLSTCDAASGLLDEEGYLHRTSEAVHERGEPAAAQREVQAQVTSALHNGIDVTHVDTHMGTVGHPKFAPAYVQLALQHRVPLMMMRHDEAGWRRMGYGDQMAVMAAGFVRQLEAQGLPLLDHMVMLPLDAPSERVELAKRMLEGLPSGLTHFIIHPGHDTPELRAVATGSWPSRVADYEAFTSRELRDYVRASDLQVIGYRALRELMRGE
jgi:predicted glycoside hydrolase/deacetylase ChbG (UPF0249 family)